MSFFYIVFFKFRWILPSKLSFKGGGFLRVFFDMAAELRLSDFKVQELANTAWAFATASQQDAQLFAELARAAELRLGDFNVQDLANTAWAFATASQQDAQLFAALARAA